MTQETTVERYAVYEAFLASPRAYGNPYLEVEAATEITRPDGSRGEIPLFWDGEGRWGLRLSPDREGTWRWRVRANDGALDGAAGAFTCVSSDRHGGLMPMAHYPFCLQRQDGTPVWLFGDTNWRAFATDSTSRLDRAAVMHYVDVRAAQGFNYVPSDVMGGVGVDGQQHVFHDFAAERLNPAHFQEMDVRLAYMNAHGITSGIMLAWGNGAESWEAFASQEARLRYARYIVARYSAYDVVFVVSGEWDLLGRDTQDVFRGIGREIQRWDPHDRLRSIHPCRPRTVEEFATEPWMSFGDYQQQYRAPKHREATAAERNSLRNHLLKPRVHGKPVVNAEYAYYLRSMAGEPHNYAASEGIEGVDKEHSHTRDSFRRASWAVAMAGAHLVTGFGSTYFGGWRERGPFDVDAPKNDDGEADLACLNAFFTSLEWWRLTPLDGLVRADEGYAWCLADIGETYVLYSEGATHLRFGPDGEPGSALRVRRFDPRTGEWTELADVPCDGVAEIALPDDQDWVVLAQRSL